jgi:hypothetical protein
MSKETDPPAPERSGTGKLTIEPPEKHKAADRAGKTLGNMVGSINKVLGMDDEPVVLNRKGPHSSIRDLEDLIDKALEETQSSHE